MTTTIGTTWASSHRYSIEAGHVGTWAAACQHAYDMLRRSLTIEQQLEANITPVEPERPRLVHGIEFMIWQTCVEIPGTGIVLRMEIIDDLPNEEASPSVRIGARRPTPEPPAPGNC